MGRRPNPQRKQDLLEEIIDYLGENGIGELSLRPLAGRLGTSTYTLTYQFGSKDGLLVDAVQFAENRQFEQLEAWQEEDPDITATALLKKYWAWTIEEKNLRLVRLLIEATTLGRSQPDVFGPVGERIVNRWNDILRERLSANGFSTAEARRLATQLCATVVGLQFDLIATGDHKRVGKAFDELAKGVDAQVQTAALA